MPAPDTQAPRLVATIGMHASASTWVFNVVRELLIAAVGDAQVLTFYADELHQMPDEAARAGRHLVIKSHHGSAELDTWLATAQAPVFLSMRDPRDACISMSQRFKAPLNHSVRWIANDCNRLLRLAPQGHPMLRYEDRFSTILHQRNISPTPSACASRRRRSRPFSPATAPRRCGRLPSGSPTCRRSA